MTVEATRLRPGPAAEAWLDARVAELKGADALAPLTVVVPSHYAALTLRRRLAAGGYANVRHVILARVAESIGGPALAAMGRSPLTSVTEEAAIRAALRQAGGIGPQTEHRAVVTTLQGLFRDLGATRLDAADRDRLAGGGELARIAIGAYEHYRELLRSAALYDSTDVIESATAMLAEDGPDAIAEWGPLCVYLPHRLSSADLALLAAAGNRSRVVLGVPDLGDVEADAGPRRWLHALGIDWGSLPAPGEAAPTVPASARVLIAPDAGEEVRAAVRMLLADLDAGRVPLHRTAIVYRNPEPYQQLVRETLDAAGLPWAGLGGRSIAESFAGRGLLGLLHLRGKDFSRSAVINWLSSMPHGGSGPSLAQWDRLSREAGVVREVRQWQDRLKLEADRKQKRLDGLIAEDDDSSLPLRGYLQSEISASGQMTSRIQEMARVTRAPDDARWPALAEWARGLLKSHVHNPRWGAAELEASQLVEETIDSLAAAAELDEQVGVDRFVETLEEALRARRRPQGRLGQGVATGPISATAGMRFDRVYLLGMTERAYPAPPPVDPIFPWDSGADPLARLERRLAEERLDYRAALAASGAVILCFPTHDTEQRPAYPARWLLEAVAALGGDRIGPKALRELAPDAQARPWLTSLVSTEAALRHAPAFLNLAERRVAEARAITVAGGSLAASGLGRREDLPLGRGLKAAAARASSAFTEFDGNLVEVAPRIQRLAGGLAGSTLPISASGVETWAGCPFHYFLGRVIDVEPTERPEDEESWTISALDRGSLIHAILEEFFRELSASGRPAPGELYTETDRELLQTIASKRFRVVEELGQTGYRLAWQNTQSAILLDLETLLERDQQFRAENAVRPAYFEQRFGFEDGWPAAEVELSGGVKVLLRGLIDRVDVGDGAAYVTDYKTGVASRASDFQEDPVLAGTKVQLAVYSNAVRRGLTSLGNPVGRVTASYWFISAKGGFARVQVDDEVASATRLAQVMEVVHEGLKTGAFPQVPGEEGFMPGRPSFENCKFCEYHRVCPIGRDQIHDRKVTSPGADLPSRLVLR
ncbi:MAG TPA: PD-(D/E)XK nuclease family protein [Candidatus Dormibacteraeota bacterium]|nr:PD-(D/E)XK nuclease family protein [Candidatus Dormibacteraeota bacterium]